MIGQLRCQKTRRTLRVNILGPLKKRTTMITIIYSNNGNNNNNNNNNNNIATMIIITWKERVTYK